MFNDTVKRFVKSHPTRVRGLKLLKLVRYKMPIVAPHTGAWIETEKHGLDLRDGSRRTPHGCVD